jgi:putative tryptophan/tyrosine transport system substrate-binding protein
MRRRNFLKFLCGTWVFWPFGAGARQTGRIARIGVLWHAGSAQEEGSNFPALIAGFSDVGYVEGHTIILEHRFPNEEPARFRDMAAELVASGVDVLVAVGANAAPYAKQATTRVPVVFAIVPDPLGTGLVKSLSRPEGNVTGFSNSAADLIGKRLELFRELLPGLSRVALLVNANSPLAESYTDTTKAAASNLELSEAAFSWRSPDELESVFGAMKAAGIQAVITNPDGWAFTHRGTIAKLALGHGVALGTWSRQTFDAGALMSYGVNHDAICRRIAVYVDKLLKGAKPNELPVEQPTKFEFFINLKTAKALGIEIAPSILSRADEVIE